MRIFSREEALRRAEDALKYRDAHLHRHTPLPNGMVVDTARMLDTQKYETAVLRDGVWYAVEEYEYEEEANHWHEKWCQVLSDRPDMPLVDIHEAELSAEVSE